MKQEDRDVLVFCAVVLLILATLFICLMRTKSAADVEYIPAPATAE